MAKEKSFWRWLIRRPFKLVTNFLKLQIIVSMLSALIVAVFFSHEPISQIMLKQNDQQAINDEIKTVGKNGETLFFKEQLALFNGENGKSIYLAILGSVYDVTKGVKNYGPGCAYNFFVGHDASVSFITGEFENFDPAQADDVLQHVKGRDLLGLDAWKHFYDKEYIYKGKLIGRFYNEEGELTEYHHKYLAAIKQAEEVQKSVEQLSTLYPECNIKWSAEKGTHVWCTKSSGGKDRQWIGYPRKLFQIGKDDFRCACIRAEDLETTAVMLKEYENCDSRVHECYYKVD